jgi:2-succinyl-5-enolpyruvyl-6-hydroxy-3-cyclohexene-1-carboxylate synthase
VQATFCGCLVDEWVRSGVGDAVICPGSRSTPLALALAAHRALRIHVRLDERSAGFFALGIAKASRRPVVVCTTSGTAAAELHPAVVEAHHGAVPLVVCTADRPPRLQGVGAAQTIDQSAIYAGATRWSLAPGIATWRDRRTWRSIGSRAVAEASESPLGPGPVHLDLAFDEPLVGSPLELPPGRPDGSPWHVVMRPAQRESPLPIFPALVAARRVLVVAGENAGPADKVLQMAAALGSPVLADPTSGCRSERDAVVACADSILRDDTVAARLRPEVVLRLGGLHASKVLAGRLREWSECGTTQVHVDGRWRWVDPDRDAGAIVATDTTTFCETLIAFVSAADEAKQTDRDWLGDWRAAESAAQEAIASWCSRRTTLTEPGVARAVGGALPADSTLVVSSSMPVRDLEWFAPAGIPRVLANRGANGIDGVVSTAAGVAAVSGGPVVALVGDLAFLHDLTALVNAPGAANNLIVVVIDNGGGAIFSFLPQREALEADLFDRIFVTPQAVDVANVAAGLGMDVIDVPTVSDLGDALVRVTGPATCDITDTGTAGRYATLIRVRVPGGDRNVADHAEIVSEVTAKVVARLA